MRQKHKNTMKDEAFNVVLSISKAKELHRRLVLKAHPDKHPQNVDLATELTALINASRFNHRELLAIGHRVEEELNAPLD